MRNILIAVFLLLALPAQASPIYSKNFYFGGTFTGQDVNPALNDGKGINTPYVTPWETVSIDIVAVDIVFFQGASSVWYAFAGNGFSPDIMRWYGLPNPIPAGLAFPFPASGGANPPHIDLHVNGVLGQPYQGFYTVYYTKD